MQKQLMRSALETCTVEVLTKHALPMIRSDAPAQQASTQQLVAPLVSLQGMLQEVAGMVENVLAYVKQVNQGQVQGDPKIGRYLLETLASVPLASASKTSFDEDFNNHLAVRTLPCHSPQQTVIPPAHKKF